MFKRCVALTVLPLSLAIMGCSGAADDSDGDPESACNHASRLQDVEVYDGSYGVTSAFVARHRRAVGLLYWKSDLAVRYREQAGNVSGQGWCTGTLIDEDLFLTAGHCLDNVNAGGWRLPREKGGIPLSPSDLAREFMVAFRYEAAAQPALTAPVEDVEVVRLEEYRLGGVDYALLRLANAPGLRHGVARLSAVDTTRQAPIVILQHPMAELMKIGGGSVAAISGGKLSYVIDTKPGSSGAGILDARSGKIVGIHTDGGCTKKGGANFGPTIGAIAQASPIVRGLLDTSRDFFVGDFDGNGMSDLAVFFRGCLYPDADHDGNPDPGLVECPPDANAEEYFVGHWSPRTPSGLGWRRGGCVYLDSNPTRPLCLANDARFQLLVADWNGDGQSDLGVLRDNCASFDTNLDGSLDTPTYCYGNGLAEDEYLVGRWKPGHDSIALRDGYTLTPDIDHDGLPETDLIKQFGLGGEDDQYLAFDSNGDGQDEFAVRKRGALLIDRSTDANPNAYEQRGYNDFWSQYH